MRPTRDHILMEVARVFATRGTCDKAYVGAVIARDSHVISTGYNGSPSGMPHCLDVGCQIENDHCVRTSHAEANAIAFAAKEGLSTKGASLYCTHVPCPTCIKLIINAGIVRVVIPPGAMGSYSSWTPSYTLLEEAKVAFEYPDQGVAHTQKPGL